MKMCLISSQYKCKYTQITRHDIRHVRIFSVVAQFLGLSLAIREKGDVRKILSTAFNLYSVFFNLPSTRRSICDQNFYCPKMNRTWDVGLFWHLYTKHFSPNAKRDMILTAYFSLLSHRAFVQISTWVWTRIKSALTPYTKWIRSLEEHLFCLSPYLYLVLN